MTRKTKTPIVEADTDVEARERQIAQNEAWLNDPRNLWDLEEGRLGLEAERAAAAKAQAEDPMETWAKKLAAEQMTRRPELANLETAEERERREELQRRLDEEEPVVFVQRSPGTPEGSPAAPVQQSVQAPVWSAAAKLAVPPKDADDPFDVGQVLDVTVKLFSREDGYHLVLVFEDGTEDHLWAGTNYDGWGATAARRRLKIDPEADWATFNALPKTHEAEKRRQQWLADRIASFPVEPGRRREVYREYDIVTGEVIGYSDGVRSWSA
jgi:hypothetical protein